MPADDTRPCPYCGGPLTLRRSLADPQRAWYVCEHCRGEYEARPPGDGYVVGRPLA